MHLATRSFDSVGRRWAWGRGLLSLGAPVPGLWRQAAAAAEPRADLPILVVVELTGGNDGLNTVVPHADDIYHKSRPTLRIEPDKVLKLDDHVGLHPALKELHALWESGDLAVIQGVGYPEPEPLALPLDGDLADGRRRSRAAGGLAGPGRRRATRSGALSRRAAIGAAGGPRPKGDSPGAGQPGRLSARARCADCADLPEADRAG